MDEDEEEAEAGEEGDGTRDTPIEVAAEVVVPREEPKPVEAKQKMRAEEATTRTLPKSGAAAAAAMEQWAGGPPKDRRRVVVDESSVGGGRQEKRGAVETHRWLGTLRQEVKRDDNQLIRRSGTCLCSKIWRSRQWRSQCGQPHEKRR